MHRKHTIVATALFLACSAFSAGCGGSDSAAAGTSFILCSAIDADGRTNGDVLVMDDEGLLLRTVSLGEPPLPAAQGLGPWVLYHSVATDDRWFVGALDGSVEDAGTHVPNWGSSPEGHRFAAAESFADSEGDKRVMLYDFATGTVTDLTSVLDPEQPGVVVWSGSDAAETNLLMWDSAGGAWVIPTSDPGAAWDLGDRSVPGQISDDGKEVVFRDREGDVFIGNLDDQSTALLLDDPGFAVPRFADGSDVLLQTTTQLVLIDRDGSQRILWETEEEAFPVSQPSMGEGGRTVVVGFGTDEPTWLHVTLTDGATTALPLGDMRVLTGTDDFLITAEARTVAAPKVDTLAIIDLAMGSVRFVNLPEGGIRDWVITSPAGNALVLSGQSGLHLLDLETGSLTSLGPDVRAARFSPDGTRLVIDVWDGSDQASGDIAVVSAGDPGDYEPVGANCIQPVWVSSG